MYRARAVCRNVLTYSIRLLWLVATLRLVNGALAETISIQTDELINGTEFIPPQGKGAAVIVVSGSSGPFAYAAPFSRQLAQNGYDVLAVGSGKADSVAVLRGVIRELQSSPHANAGKVAVVAFSVGGGRALLNATTLPEAVGSIVLYYPVTSWLTTSDAILRNVVAAIKVPTLLLVGGADANQNCCTADTARRIEAVARELSVPVTLIIYPRAGHGFESNPNDASDALRQTLAHIRHYQ
jgi:dienelactone hydrolase